MPASSTRVDYDRERGDGAATTKCKDPNCRCQLTDLPEPLRPGSAPGRPSQMRRTASQDAFKEDDGTGP